MQTRDSNLWTWVGTSNPAEKIFALFVQTDKITLTNTPKRASLPGIIPATEPTAYKDIDECFKLPSLGEMGINDWHFIGESIGPERSTFYFFKNKTASELLVPFYDDSPGKIGNHPWEPIIYDIWIEADYSFPQTSQNINDSGVLETVTAPTLYIKALMADEIFKGSSFITRRYLSAVQPMRPRINTPDPRSIVVEVNGTRREFPPSFHDDITIEFAPSGTRAYSASGGARDLGGSTSSLFFEATKPTTRRPHILTWEPVQNPYGLWETTSVEVRPPKIKQSDLVIR